MNAIEQIRRSISPLANGHEIFTSATIGVQDVVRILDYGSPFRISRYMWRKPHTSFEIRER